MSIIRRLLAVICFGLFALYVARGEAFRDNTLVGETQGGDSRTFSAIYEPSGITHLGEGRFIAVEDEAGQPFRLLRLSEDGRRLREDPDTEIDGAAGLNDLEGVTFDGRFVYAITSHSLTKKGKPGKNRQVLARYDYQQGVLLPAGRIEDLKAGLLDLLKQAYPQKSRKKLAKRLNIEALAWSPLSGNLYVGLRAPVIDGESLIIEITEPAALFEAGSGAAMNGRLYALELDEQGIRAMDWDAKNNQFMLVAGDKKQDETAFSLWSWAGYAVNGQGSDSAAAVKITSLAAGTEGLALVRTIDFSGMILLQDDGKRNKQRPAQYRIVPEQYRNAYRLNP